MAAAAAQAWRLRALSKRALQFRPDGNESPDIPLRLDAPTAIGRAPDNDVRLPPTWTQISSRHAQLAWDEAQARRAGGRCAPGARPCACTCSACFSARRRRLCPARPRTASPCAGGVGGHGPEHQRHVCQQQEGWQGPQLPRQARRLGAPGRRLLSRRRSASCRCRS